VIAGSVVLGVAGRVADWWRDQKNPPAGGGRTPPIYTALAGVVIALCIFVWRVQNAPDTPPSVPDDTSHLSCEPDHTESNPFGSGTINVHRCVSTES
jgi:hypothetical protein